jgi:hypothetical protein
MTGWLARRRVSLPRLISRQCGCSRRCVYLLDEHFYSPTDAEINEFVASVRPTQFNWAHEIHDCDDLAFEFYVKARCWFRARDKNVAVATIARKGTSSKKPHAFNFFVRKGDHKLIFIDRFERVSLAGRAYLVIM